MKKILLPLPLIASVAVALCIGCIDIRVNTNSGGQGVSGAYAYNLTGPSPSSGQIAPQYGEIGVNANGDSDCFPSSTWDGYVTFPLFFEGPGGSHLGPVYPNSGNLTTLVIKTCNPVNNNNGLRAGIVIRQLGSTTIKWCFYPGQGGCALPNLGMLTVGQIPMVSGKRYQANVYFQKSTVAPLSSVTVDWNYQ